VKSFIASLTTVAIFFGLVASAGAAYSNGFESNTDGWFEFEGSGTITRQENGYVNPGGYASGIPSADGEYHARLGRGTCGTETGGGGQVVNCPGPYTNWGGYNSTWTGGYTTQLDIYLDTEYAQANEDSYAGNIECLTATDPSTEPACKGTRFDYTSAINDNEGNHLRDFGFNVSTGYGEAGENCAGFVVTGQTNVNRSGANPNAGGHDPVCIDEPGWYTFKHTFSEEEFGGEEYLKVVMEIIPVGTATPVASWTITGQDKISTVGCNRYGWLSDQEVYGLPIDNASMTGCGAPTVVEGQISPTKTTCEEFRDGTASVLGEVQYTTKGDFLNALSPGVFFYYGKVSGNENETVAITQTHTGTAPPIPILNGQVVLYDASTCSKLKWNVEEGETGEATGTLPSSGDFIIGVKYSPSALKGQPVPEPPDVTYSFGTTEVATVVLAPRD
jgi:hypothetical protein